MVDKNCIYFKICNKYKPENPKNLEKATHTEENDCTHQYIGNKIKKQINTYGLIIHKFTGNSTQSSIRNHNIETS